MIVLCLFLHSVLPFWQDIFMLCTSYGVFFVDFVNISCIFIILKSNYFAVYFRYADVFLLKNKPHMGFGLRNNSATIRINKPQKAHNRHSFRLCAFLFLQGCFLQSIEVCKSFTAHKVINSKQYSLPLVILIYSVFSGYPNYWHWAFFSCYLFWQNLCPLLHLLLLQ